MHREIVSLRGRAIAPATTTGAFPFFCFFFSIKRFYHRFIRRGNRDREIISARVFHTLVRARCRASACRRDLIVQSRERAGLHFRTPSDLSTTDHVVKSNNKRRQTRYASPNLQRRSWSTIVRGRRRIKIRGAISASERAHDDLSVASC